MAVSSECNGQCVSCTDGTDDPNCVTAYGSGYLCGGGACVMGNCHTSAQCTGGNAGYICGVTTPFTCGMCTADIQCQDDSNYGSGDICDTTTGQCVAATCTTANMTCPNNPADECCTIGGAITSTKCVPGNCCTSSQCTSGETCQGGTCTACSAATGNNYFVDPAAGSDNGHTGASSCPFKTITKALEFIGTNAAAGTTIQLLDDDPASNGETYPLTIPANITVETATTVSTPVTVTVVAAKSGFILDSATSGISNLVIDGNTNAANSGVVVGGNAAATTTVSNATVQNFKNAGIVVGAGAVTLGPGLTVKGNGTNAAPAPGIAVPGGNAIITGTAAAGTAGHTSISSNSQHGVLVSNKGYITVNGSATAVTTTGTAFVDFDNNQIAGIWIAQTPTAVTLAQTNVVSGVEVTGIVTGNGIHVEGGSFFTLRNSYVVGNHDSGVVIVPFGAGATANTSIANIDLGQTLTPGGNTLQGPVNNQTNPVSGVCLNIPAAAASGQTLNAAGDIWSATVDCRTDATGKVTHAAGCANGVDIGGILGTGNTNTANVSVCSLQ